MFRFTVRRVAALASIGVIALVGSAMAAAGKKVTSCGNRAGKTLLEDGAARVYKHHGLDYACARPTGRSSKLFQPDVLGDPVMPASGVELAGKYAVWSQYDDGTATGTIVLLDVATRTYRTVDSLSGAHSSIGGFVVNSSGTVVYTENYEACIGLSNGKSGCEASTTVTSSSVHGTSTLADVTNSSTSPPEPQASLPITSLGLSNDGTVAFWVDDGKYKGASIS